MQPNKDHIEEFSSEASLKLITQMINKARSDYFETGVSALMWGAIITFCSLMTFANYWWQFSWMGWVWLLTIVAVIPQIVIAVQESKARKRKMHDEDMMSGIWISFGIAMFLLSYLQGKYKIPHQIELSLILYGIPTFTSGYARRFKPMIIGGIACWIFVIITGFTSWPYSILYLAAGAQLAWFIPGIILRKRYLKAKRNNV